ncbi:MAG: MoxR family ATPase [Spirochaetota bacterium]|nr:MoxR family ATPase [Spirochaetota bacterium]
MNPNIEMLQNLIDNEKSSIQNLKNEIGKVVIGQNKMINKLLIGLITGGHILLEGVPGLAKTLSIKTIAQTINAQFKRIQFTPDLLPADLLGTLIYNQKKTNFTVRKGPIFSNIILADEINRAPSKVQSALLECMQEKQVTIGNKTYPLSNLFWVLATENPIEHEGTYPLPEAQIDRFMLKIKIDYPSVDEEKRIIRQVIEKEELIVNKVYNEDNVLALQEIVRKIHIDEKLIEYITNITNATRYPEKQGLLSDLISFGASPRASIYLTLASKGHAFLEGRAYVIPEDIKAIAHDILRHRIILSYEAEAEEKSTDEIIDIIFQQIQVP